MVNTFWIFNAQYSDSSQQAYIIDFKVAKRLDLNFSYCIKEMIIVWDDKGVS